MIKLRDRLIWTLSGIVAGVCISLALTCSYGGITRFKTPLEIEEKVLKYELKQEYKNMAITKDTVESNAERITRLERYIFEKGAE